MAANPNPARPSLPLDAPRMAPGEISPKAKLAALFTALATVLIVAGHTLATGEFNATEVGETVVGFSGAVAAFTGGYTGRPGHVEVVGGGRDR